MAGPLDSGSAPVAMLACLDQASGLVAHFMDLWIKGCFLKRYAAQKVKSPIRGLYLFHQPNMAIRSPLQMPELC